MNPQNWKALLAVAALGMASTSCKKNPTGPPPPPPPEKVVLVLTPPAATIAFSRTDSATIESYVQNADRCDKAGGWNGSASRTGEVVRVSPDVTTTYTVTCSNAAGSVTESVTVTVLPPPPVGQRVTKDRPDDSTLSQIHVIYAIPMNGKDRSYDLANIGIAVDSMQNWMRQQTGGQSLRFDLYQGKLDVTFFQLKNTEDAYRAPTGGIEFLNELTESGLFNGYPGKRYLVYFEGGIPAACGTANRIFAIVTLRCGQTPDYNPPLTGHPISFMWNMTSLHEVLHTLGYVYKEAPHHDAANPMHVNDSRFDLMYGGNCPPGVTCSPMDHSWKPESLDVGHDDYFGENLPSGVKNLRDDPFMLPVSR